MKKNKKFDETFLLAPTQVTLQRRDLYRAFRIATGFIIITGVLLAKCARK